LFTRMSSGAAAQPGFEGCVQGVVRDLLLGPKRFTDLQAGLSQAGPDLVAERLRDLEDAGVMRNRTLAPATGSRVCKLTEWGAELEPTLSLVGLGSPIPGRAAGRGHRCRRGHALATQSAS
jgi:HxlR-like helix-turn-helix